MPTQRESTSTPIEASIDHIELDEVTVEASAWVRKADRNLLFPNAQQIKQSS